MSILVICPLSQLEQTAARFQPRDLITLMNAGTPMARPAIIAPERHLNLAFNDIHEKQKGLVEPSVEHINALIDAARCWDRHAPLLIHCYMGISRSTAAAYIVSCALAPEKDENQLADLLRKNAPSATPNKLMVSIADRLLNRNKKMIDAIARIGRGADAFEGEPFVFDFFN